MRIVGVTACHDGVVHNHLAAMRLSEAARKQQHDMRLEVQDQTGTASRLSVEDITSADMVIMAVDHDEFDMERFAALPVLRVSTKEAITNPLGVLAQASIVFGDDEARAFQERKLFTVGTGQAVAAYVGAAMGYKTLKDAMGDVGVIAIVKGAMEESGEVLVVQRKVDRDAHHRYIEKTLARIANPWLAGELKAAAADPQIKLGRRERLIKPLLGALEHGLPWTNLACGVAAALCYADPDDAQALALQEKIQSTGASAVIAQYVGQGAVATEIEKYWDTFQTR